MHNKASFQVSKVTYEFLERKKFTEDKIIEWSGSEFDWKSMVNRADKIILIYVS